MSKFSGVLKGGWHPEKNSSSGSSGSGSKGTFGIRNQVNGMLGRDKGGTNDGPQHIARPLSDLADPASFAPPPKRTGTGTAPAPPPSAAKRQVVAAPSKYQDPRGPKVAPPPKISSEDELADVTHGIAEVPQSPSVYRTNTTGLSTDHLPPPPGRRDGADSRGPPSYEVATQGMSSRAPPSTAPRLPPRLPPRGTNSAGSTAFNRTNPASESGTLNQGAIIRLGAAGVSVPGFGIGSNNSSDATSTRATTQSQTAGVAINPQLNELSNRFKKLGTGASDSNQAALSSSGQGTTWAQKQAALKTASNLQKDPSSVSFADTKSAVSTANNFRQRHADQISAGLQNANRVNQKYDIANQMGGVAPKLQGPESNAAQIVPPVAGKKKPPPPPLAKKPELLPTAPSQIASSDEAPPIPLATRPNFSS